MLSSISWTEFLGIVVLLLVAYYIVIGVKFYSYAIRQFILGNRKLVTNTTTHKTPTHEDESLTFPVQQTQAELFPSHKNYTPSHADDTLEQARDMLEQVQELAAGLKIAIEQAVNKNYIKEEFVLSLQLLLKKYQFLKGLPFLVAINNLIASECEKYGYIQLSAEERVMLWNE